MRALTRANKRVIQNFLERKSDESKKIYTDGESLYLNWVFGGKIAEWIEDRVRLTRIPSSKSEQIVVRYLSKKIPTFEKASQLYFEHWHHDSYKGQHYFSLFVREVRNGPIIAVADYSLFDKNIADGREAQIDSIEVKKDQRRRGIASKMLHEIKRKHRIKNIPPSLLTEEGAKWRKGIDKGFTNGQRF